MTAALKRQGDEARRSGQGSQRLSGIDAVRAAMAFLVIVLHAIQFGDEDRLHMTLQIFSLPLRAAVPFFFIASGFFIKQRDRLTPDIVVQPMIRLLPIYVFWVAVYYVAAALIPGHASAFHLRDIVMGGPAFHLWFLPALGISMVLVAVGLPVVRWRVTGIVCALIAAVGLARGSYHDVLHLHGSASRGGIMVAPLFVYLGAAIRARSLTLSSLVSLGGIAASLLALYCEEVWIGAQTHADFSSHDFALMTYPLGIFCFFLALSLPNSGIVEKIATLGKYSLGVYTSHLLFLWIAFAISGAMAVFILPNSLAAFAAGLAISIVLSRSKIFRRVVS
ncbi:acyltransferase [Flavisphingomonas formosensis]|uniref:acyltransferase n=1 Tax=Flavisphingomonas formosensis TaxID=861534 RepID=UPI0012FC1B65|nr:acyltransferase [Sphingomonas formosensis]